MAYLKEGAKVIKETEGALYTEEGLMFMEGLGNLTQSSQTMGRKEEAYKVPDDKTVVLDAEFQINRLALLSLLYGMNVTNNWLKMHGGIMTRRGGRRKEKSYV